MPPGLDRLGAVADQITEDVNSGKLGDSAGNTKTPEDSSNENETETDNTEVVAAAGDKGTKAQTSNKSIFDLGKQEKVLFEGKEWSVKDLKAAFLRQSDYTRKTQEIAKEREYVENLPADLERLRQDPTLLSRFKEIYPQSYHDLAERVTQGLEQPKKQAGNQTEIDPRIQNELRQIKADNARLLQDVEQRELTAINAKLDAMASDMAKKHGLEKEEASVVEEMVLAKADIWMNQNPRAKMTDEKWSEFWEQTSKRYQKLQDDAYARKIKSQKTVSQEGRDIGGGGGAPGSSPKRETISQATERAIRELSGR